MRFHRSIVILLLIGFISPGQLIAQDRCAFDEYQKLLQEKNPGRNQPDFEKWMREKVKTQPRTSAPGNRTASATYTIPIVIHVIHNGEPVGTGSNISDAQILSQIAVLNEDFNRENQDQINTPAEFAAVAGNIDIEFVIARQDPDGLPTNGIVRVKGSKTSWAYSDNFAIKSNSYWPAEDYLNIWVLPFSGNTLGFAQFPVTDLNGVEGPYDRLTDGVAIDYTVFGTSNAGSFNLDPQYNKGRTTTHEVGHYFSMLHIFGDLSGCTTATDYVDDTPSQSSKTLNCPTHPSASCGHPKMFQNYLDYTDDVCMNLFTMGQMQRMEVVLQNSPRRNSLLTSHGLLAPVVHVLDAEARQIISPIGPTCGRSITPRVSIRNRGTTKLTEANVQLRLNDVPVETIHFNLNLNQLEETVIDFSMINLPEPSTNNITYKIITVNGTTDNETANDIVSGSVQVSSRKQLPITESFSTTPPDWRVINPDNGITWDIANAGTGNKAMSVNFYTYESETARDQLLTPILDLANATSPILKFDRAYARFPNKAGEGLRVLALPGCGHNPSEAVEIYKKLSTDLATANDSSSPFVPSTAAHWKQEVLFIQQYAGQNLQLIFESINAYGNNLYVDNVRIETDLYYDVALTKISSPSIVSCVEKPQPVIQIQNLGSSVVNRLHVTTKVNGVTVSTQTFTGLLIAGGSEFTATLNAVSLVSGKNEINISIKDLDAPSDFVPENNSKTLSAVLNQEEERIPYRQQLEDGLSGWTIVSQGAAQEWELKSTTTNQNSAVYQGFDNPNKGEESWMVSPSLDFSKASTASMFFDSSYGLRATGSETLRIYASADCGENFNEIIFEKPTANETLANENVTQRWVPADETDWRTEYISLNDYAGLSQVRFAFVAINNNGNDLYLDNFEWYLGDDPFPPKTEDLFSIYNAVTEPFDFKITFRLPEKETSRLVVYNMMGQVILDNQLPETLNQTYTISLTGQSTGVYIAKVQAGGQIKATRLFIGR